MSLTVWVGGSPIVIDAPQGVTVLDAALSAGINFPFGCQSGECGVCRCNLISGPDIKELPYDSFALSARQREQGQILACCTLLHGDAVIRLRCPDVVPHGPLSGQVTAVERVTDSVVIVRVVPDLERTFFFKAGQFARLTLPNGTAREYSMANLPGQLPLEFHIRRMDGGKASSYAYDHLAVGDPISLAGPFGDAWYRPEHTGPILGIAGGTGLAPLKSIVCSALEQDPSRRVALYIGMRHEKDLYDLDLFRGLAARHSNFTFVPVLSDTYKAAGYRTGLVTDAVRSDAPLWPSAKLYMAGPPAMIRAGMQIAAELGIAADNWHADAFVTAADRAAEPLQDGAASR